MPDEFEKRIFGQSSDKLESFLSASEKCLKYTLIPISILVSIVLIDKVGSTSVYLRYLKFFLLFWSGIFSCLIFMTYSFKIEASSLSVFVKYSLKISLLILLGSVLLSGFMISASDLP